MFERERSSILLSPKLSPCCCSGSEGWIVLSWGPAGAAIDWTLGAYTLLPHVNWMSCLLCCPFTFRPLLLSQLNNIMWNFIANYADLIWWSLLQLYYNWCEENKRGVWIVISTLWKITCHLHLEHQVDQVLESARNNIELEKIESETTL